jgi:uncharacterized protein YdaT
MPWGAKDATRFTKKARSKPAKRQFAAVANAMLAKTHDEGRAIRAANSAVAKRKKRRS